ncbi:unnamed protein product, partial [Rotaria magnacalcarata]
MISHLEWQEPMKDFEWLASAEVLMKYHRVLNKNLSHPEKNL